MTVIAHMCSRVEHLAPYVICKHKAITENTKKQHFEYQRLCGNSNQPLLVYQQIAAQQQCKDISESILNIRSTKSIAIVAKCFNQEAFFSCKKVTSTNNKSKEI